MRFAHDICAWFQIYQEWSLRSVRTVDFYIANARDIDEDDHVEVENWDYVHVELTKKAASVDKRGRDRGDKFRSW